VRTQPFDQVVREFFAGEGFQAGFEAAGAQGSLDLLMKNVEKGGEIAIIGVYARNPVVNMYYLGEHELRLTGTLMYKHEDYLEAVDAIADGTVMLDPLISAYFPSISLGMPIAILQRRKTRS